MKIINKIYNIEGHINKSIVLISDIHYSNKKDIKRLNYVLDNIKKIKPDYICIPGDITNKSIINDEEYLIDWLKKLTLICKVIVSIGNHEFYINKWKKIYGLNKELLKKISKIDNLYILDNKNIIIDEINFMGITIPIEYYKINKSVEDYNKLFDALKTNKKYYNILLCHSPVDIVNEELLKNRNINLILCGHTHGGAVLEIFRPIFKNNGFISANYKLFPKNVYGMLQIESTAIITTSGLKVLPFKLLNKLFSLEIVKINL